MAIEKGKRIWQEILSTTTYTELRRKLGSGVLETTGILKLNTNSSSDWGEILGASKLDLTTCMSKFFVDGKLVAARVVPFGTPGGIAFRQTPVKGGKTPITTLYLHGVFEQYPKLRPAGRCRVSVALDTDEYGAHLVINLGSQLAMLTKSKSSDDSAETAQNKTAATKQTRNRKQKQGEATKPAAADTNLESESEQES